MSGRHRVDAHLVADFLHVEKLLRADADFVRQWPSFAIDEDWRVNTIFNYYS